MIMKIEQNKNGNELKIALHGRLDTATAPELEEVIKSSLDGVTELVLDIEKLDYISSAGLRVLLAAQKVMNRQGSMVIRNVTPEIMDIFDVTGFVDILNIE